MQNLFHIDEATTQFDYVLISFYSVFSKQSHPYFSLVIDGLPYFRAFIWVWPLSYILALEFRLATMDLGLESRLLYCFVLLDLFCWIWISLNTLVWVFFVDGFPRHKCLCYIKPWGTLLGFRIGLDLFLIQKRPLYLLYLQLFPIIYILNSFKIYLMFCLNL